ncbi:MAG: UDP-N-acetylmuramate--L-alanine ligase [Saprospiraceae bacterium]|nr:UDP-N-acetylmuramate--L-alanine ligase [Saprospiraceae bacterium]
MKTLQQLKNIYFIGIGGIGMSAIARYFNERGVKILGYDKTQTVLTDQLSAEGMDICYENNYAEPFPTLIDLVIYTPAVPLTHPVCQHFKASGLPFMKRAEILGLISKNMKTIAIGGTHGKTTTSSITTHLLKEGGVSCTAFLGGIVENFGGNYVSGQSDWVVIEADEFDRSFLHLHPEIAAILSTDADHLDIYGSLESLIDTGFKPFAAQTAADGLLLIQHASVNLFPSTGNKQSFGIEEGDFKAVNIRLESNALIFDYQHSDILIKDLKFSLPGRHNVLNAVVAITIALRLGVSEEAIRENLLTFKGIQRRFDIKLVNDKMVIISDYAHHPTELNAVISAARELYPGKKITAVFQPHLFSRTKDFLDGFAKVLSALDSVILLPIYPAREEPIPGIDSALLLQKISILDKKLVDSDGLILSLNQVQPEVLLMLGAGDFDRMLPQIVDMYHVKTLKE